MRMTELKPWISNKRLNLNVKLMRVKETSKPPFKLDSDESPEDFIQSNNTQSFAPVDQQHFCLEYAIRQLFKGSVRTLFRGSHNHWHNLHLILEYP